MDNLDRASYLYSRDPSVDRRYRPCPERRVKLYDYINEEDITDEPSEEPTDGASSGHSILSNESCTASVYLRLRPIKSQKSTPLYNIDGNILKTHCLESSTSANKDLSEKHFKFNRIFNDMTTQREIYNRCAYDAIDNEDNLTILMYGTSGSGKTYTLLGTREDPGIVPIAIHHIFTRYSNIISPTAVLKLIAGNIIIVDDEQAAQEVIIRDTLIANELDTDSCHFDVADEFEKCEFKNRGVCIWVSFIEIYNEFVFDLLAPNPKESRKENVPNNNNRKQSNLKIILNNGDAFIKNLTSIYCVNSQQAMDLLKVGQKRINYASTNINRNSSRSHCIFCIDILSYSMLGAYEHISYRYCDLAGSERLKKTDNTGHRLKEARCINNSLMVLGRCLDAVNTNQHKKSSNHGELVPLRESKLTMLLQGSLLGQDPLKMIVNLSPCEDFYEENLNVLNFAAIAKQIVYKKPSKKKRITTNTRMSWFMAKATSSPRRESSSEQSLLLDENFKLKNEIEEYKEYIDTLQRQMKNQEQELRYELFEKYDVHIRAMTETNNKVVALRDKTITELRHKIETLQNTLRDAHNEIEQLRQEDDGDDVQIVEVADDNDDIQIVEQTEPISKKPRLTF